MIEPQCTEKVVWWLGETKGFWVQTGALFLSAIGALWIVMSREKSERRRATVELVLHNTSNSDLKTAKKEFLKLLESGDKNLARFSSQPDTSQYDAIMRILNTHEFVCVGMREKAYDEALYKQMQCAVIIRDWEALSGFVQEFRNSKKAMFGADIDTFYWDFEQVATRWKEKPLKRRKKKWLW